MDSASQQNYKRFHEGYVLTRKGTSPWECLMLVTPYPFLVFISCYMVHLLLPSDKTKRGLRQFLIEFSIIVLPLIFSLTLFHPYAHFLLMAVISSVVFCLVYYMLKCTPNYIKIVFTVITPCEKRPYVTYFRAIVSLITALCILAVDFKIFPREFAKTESYGFSLMDTGVGFFIAANGIVTKSNSRENIIKIIKSTLPIVGLAIFRCVVVKTLNYQQVVSEYGTHWNFFFTLAAVRLLVPCLLTVWPYGELYLGLAIAVVHHCILGLGVEAWVVSDAPRTNVLSANREGIVSLPGYLSLYLLHIALGKALLRNYVDLQRDVKLVGKGFVSSLILYVIVLNLHTKYPASRRFANATFILWMLSMVMFLLSITIIIEISLRLIYSIKGISNDYLIPTLLNSINYNGLLYFLLANIFTGIINIYLQTLYVDVYSSIVILTMYMLLLSLFTKLFYKYRIKLTL